MRITRLVALAGVMLPLAMLAAPVLDAAPTDLVEPEPYPRTVVFELFNRDESGGG